MMRLARRFDPVRFSLSAEAEALLRRNDGRWMRVELADGPAAQALLLGGAPRYVPSEPEVEPAMEAAGDANGDLFE